MGARAAPRIAAFPGARRGPRDAPGTSNRLKPPGDFGRHPEAVPYAVGNTDAAEAAPGEVQVPCWIDEGLDSPDPRLVPYPIDRVGRGPPENAGKHRIFPQAHDFLEFLPSDSHQRRVVLLENRLVSPTQEAAQEKIP